MRVAREYRLSVGLLLGLLACAPRADSDTSSAPDSDEHPPEDRDQDGVAAQDDCDDLDPRAYPGNEETWDGRDNDCDGVVDGRGHFAGTQAVEASAIVEGEEVPLAVACPVTLDRTAGTLWFEIRCAPDVGDAAAQTLLGAEVVLTPATNGVAEGSWSGEVLWTSSNGWTATGVGHATWWSMDEVWLTTGLDTVSLEWASTGTLGRADP